MLYCQPAIAIPSLLRASSLFRLVSVVGIAGGKRHCRSHDVSDLPAVKLILNSMVLDLFFDVLSAVEVFILNLAKKVSVYAGLLLLE